MYFSKIQYSRSFKHQIQNKKIVQKYAKITRTLLPLQVFFRIIPSKRSKSILYTTPKERLKCRVVLNHFLVRIMFLVVSNYITTTHVIYKIYSRELQITRCLFSIINAVKYSYMYILALLLDSSHSLPIAKVESCKNTILLPILTP